MIRTPLSAKEKPALRGQIRAERLMRDRKTRLLLARRIRDVLLEQPVIRSARTIAAYASLPAEPGTEPLRTALRQVGVDVLLPILLPDRTLDWAPDTGATRTDPDRPGLPQPLGPALGPGALADADVIIAPALAVDTRGVRLGQGGGSYDRALRHAHPSTPVLAVVFDEELFDAGVEPLPAEPHDVRVSGALTPTRCMLFAG